MPDFFDDLAARGQLQDATPGLEDLLRQSIVSGYVGFDPTAPSLHIGNLLPMTLLRRLQLAGHRPIAVVGGATAMVGDPSFKSAERRLMSEEEVRHNEARIKLQLESYLEFDDSPTGALVLNNLDWLGNFGYLAFLREVGKHLSINYMMAKDSVQNRLEHGLSFTEFSYQLLQGYDFVHLYRQHHCRLQMGGSDQWGNITTGIELIRRMAGGEAHALTCPLLTKQDGTKFGKTEDGNVWLDAGMTSPYKFYQFWINVADEDLPRLLHFYSFNEPAALADLLAQHQANPSQRLGQKALAEELTTRLHGQAELQRAQEATEILFGKHAPAEALAKLEPAFIDEVMEGVPTGAILRSQLEEGLALVDLLAQTGAAASKGEARRLLQGGGVRLNKTKVEDPSHAVTPADAIHGQRMLLQLGKKAYFLVRIEA